MSTEPPHPLTHTCFDCYLMASIDFVACPLHATPEEREQARKAMKRALDALDVIPPADRWWRK